MGRIDDPFAFDRGAPDWRPAADPMGSFFTIHEGGQLVFG